MSERIKRQFGRYYLTNKLLTGDICRLRLKTLFAQHLLYELVQLTLKKIKKTDYVR